MTTTTISACTPMPSVNSSTPFTNASTTTTNPATSPACSTPAKANTTTTTPPLARLTRADHSQDVQDVQERFGHDPAGNRLMIQGNRHYDYDAFGNLIRERRGRAHALITEYRYDCQHRLIGITQPNGHTASYRYDPFGRRISKTVDGTTTEFFWQGDKLIAEHHADRHRSYLYEPDSFRPLALLEGFGPKETKAYHYQLDHLGTPQELTAPDGEIVWSAHYRAYGEISRLDVGKVDNSLRFQGRYFD